MYSLCIIHVHMSKYIMYSVQDLYQHAVVCSEKS